MDGQAADDDFVDSGAETGGSDYSRMSSTSSEYHFDYNFEGELSVEDVQDPFLVSIHIITDPGESKVLQEAIDKLLAWIHPDLQLFRVSERRVSRKQKKACKSFASQPALAVVLFLQEEYGEEQILQLHETFQRSPWKFHHTERVHGRFLPYMPCHQDFFTLATGTPLWAIRQVHYGKEIVRFTIYCRYEHFSDMMKLYSLILKRAGWQKKIDFCVYPVYSNMDVDIQFSLKRLPEGQNATPMESAVLEFRIKDFGQLIPLLPNPCSPISAGRWQTEDHDGNRILLQQVHCLRKKATRHSRLQSYATKNHGSNSSISFIPQSHRSAPDKPELHRTSGHDQYLCGSQWDLMDSDHGDVSSSASSASRSFQRSKSLFCLPTTSSFPSCESFPLSEPPSQILNNGLSTARTPTWRGHPRFSIDDLEGAQETDVDTGIKLSSSDLSVVSAYSSFNGFCSDLEASLPSKGPGISSSKQDVSHVKSLLAKSNLTEVSNSSLPSLSEWSSSSCISSSAPPYLPGFPLKPSQKAASGHSWESSQTTKHMQQPLEIPVPQCGEEEEFFI
ncbi:protein FAM124A isoform X3 [Rhinatrema bivittatum]|uniref:protein FAM124A isoform X3 n=1 Tax=Rhinatrema bivittatum TaxID=194408 RepID=UPI001125E536|nr:protein FAM124A isoform X3 [Rhinatrema bivittatum]